MQGYIVWNDLSGATRLVMNQLHYGGLVFMILAYTIKIRQLLQKPAAGEGTPSRGDHAAGVRYAYMTLAMPWEIDSQKRHWFRYLEFALFHMAMAVGIGYAFITPIIPETMKNPAIAMGAQAFFAAGLLTGASRLVRRIFIPEMRAISSPDDYFCLALLTLWMGSGVLAAPLTTERFLLAFYCLATFFLFYVPFSKISHYVYYPFIRYYVGKHFAHRGTFPKKALAGQKV
jgi:hypothetical protein